MEKKTRKRKRESKDRELGLESKFKRLDGT
jgi:hypothetical protein